MADIECILSRLYHALRVPRRRHVIHILEKENDSTFTTRELARRISSIEQEVPKRRATGEPYRNAYNALSQTHLPTLTEAGIIIYDPKRQTIHQGPYFDIAALVLEINTLIIRLFSLLIEINGDNSHEDIR